MYRLRARGTFFAVCLLYQISNQLVTGEVDLELHLYQYYNPESKDYDGSCCDHIRSFSCSNDCDNRFTICLDAVGSSKDMRQCPIGHIGTAQIYDGNDHFTFPSILPYRLKNPLLFTLPSWQGGIRLKGNVYDVDPTSKDDLVDIYYENIMFAADSQWHTRRIIGARSVMTIKLRAGCKATYYGKGCIRHCVPRSDERGHYTCDPVTGIKICGEGWEGPNCDHDFNECLSEPCLNNGTCDHGVNHYTCVCVYGWGGHQCHLLTDPCIHSPCINSLSCHPIEEGASHKCTCVPGWGGKNCSVNLHTCASSPCKNGGQCTDTLNNWTCKCVGGWSGKACDGVLNIRLRDQMKDNESGIGAWWISLVFAGLACVVVAVLGYMHIKRRVLPSDDENQSERNTIVADSQPVVAFHRRSMDSDITSTMSRAESKAIDDEEESFTNLNYMVTIEKLKNIEDIDNDDEDGLIGAIGGYEDTDIYGVD